MRASGVAPQFQPPTRNTPSKRMWIILLLNIFLPPVGLVLLWKSARNPLRGKVLISIVALLSMTLMLTLFLTHKRLNEKPKPVPIDNTMLEEYIEQRATPAPSPTPQPPVQLEAPDSPVVPANPLT